MGLFTRGKVWLSQDRNTYFEYDEGTGDVSLVVDGTTAKVWDGAAEGFYGAAAVAQQSMTATALTPIATTTISQVATSGKWAFATSTAAIALVTRCRQMQADLETLVTKLETAGLLSVAGVTG
jgi:hypothetical protein